LDVELTAKAAVSAVCEPVSPKIVTVDPDPKVMLVSKVAVKVLIAPETGLLCSMVEVRNLVTIVSHVVAPVAWTYLPSSHMVQTEAPTAEYLPALHSKQALGELEKLPAGHWLSTQAEPRPANENLPAVQSVQVTELVCPVAPENLPASQLVQTDAAAADWYLPASQSKQWVEPVVQAQRQITKVISIYVCTYVHVSVCVHYNVW
jgi:hypothetical protein